MTSAQERYFIYYRSKKPSGLLYFHKSAVSWLWVKSHNKACFASISLTHALTKSNKLDQFYYVEINEEKAKRFVKGLTF